MSVKVCKSPNMVNKTSQVCLVVRQRLLKYVLSFWGTFTLTLTSYHPREQLLLARKGEGMLEQDGSRR